VSETVQRLVRFFNEAKRPVLFAGAGVSAIAGVPVWAQLLSTLAEWLRAKDALSANMMVELIRKWDLLRAAEYFFLSDAVTDAERMRVLLHNLKPLNAAAVFDLCRLPFKAAITTNFDRVLNDGFAAIRREAPLDFRRGDSSFQQTLWAEDFLISRIHGAVESPSSIVLTKSHFAELGRDAVYKDVLSHFTTRANLLFVGFSFGDPAIESVLTDINRLYGPLTQGEHLALVPSDLNPEISQKLTRLCIEQLTYEHLEGDKAHTNLWSLLSKTVETLAGPAPAAMQARTASPFSTAKRYLASCYARVNLGEEITPLRNAVIEGMVSALIQQGAPKAVPVEEIVQGIHQDFALARREAAKIVNECLDALSSEKLCTWHKKLEIPTVSWNGPAEDGSRLDLAIATLVSCATDRAAVQEGLRVAEKHQHSLNSFFSHLILQRGWDLGASFASGTVPDDSDVKGIMFRSARSDVSTMDIQALVRVCETMINSPTQREAKILAALGRASFALELALKAPHTHFFHAAVLPRRIYLDANVVMPAFTFGHPLQAVYEITLKNLTTAALKVGGTQICTTTGYLSEIYNHRRLALEEYEQNPEVFAHDVMRESTYFGTAHVNVFKGAYANLLALQPDLTFAEFLREYAPYEDERQLATWLDKRGVKTIKGFDPTGLDVPAMTVELQKQYERDLLQRKNLTLIGHDAIQLAALLRDVQNGQRAVFVTADKRLREIVRAGPHSHLADHMISHVGLTQLVDLLVGVPDGSRGFSHLIWGARVSEKTNDVRQYFTTRCLQAYDEAMAMELPALVEEFADRVINEARRRGVPLENGNGQHEIFAIAGSFEDDFFQAMREKIELRERDSTT
jgi:hypothetical protein